MTGAAFVTGASSPLGERVLRILSGRGQRVDCLVRSDESACRVEALGGIPVRGDLLESGWQKRAGEASILVHLAGIRMVDCVVGIAPDKRLVAVSSASATNPNHPLARVAHESEAKLENRVGPVALLRPTMIYGSQRDRNVRYLARFLARARRVPRFSGGGLLQPIFVDDVAEVIARAVLDPSVQGRYELGGPDAVTFGELVQTVSAALGQQPLPFTLPVPVLIAGARIASTIRQSRATHALEMLRFDRTVEAAPEFLLGRTPTSLADGVARALDRYFAAASIPR